MQRIPTGTREDGNNDKQPTLTTTIHVLDSCMWLLLVVGHFAY